jgi:4-hydroxybenzoate polyprenyltransferase
LLNGSIYDTKETMTGVMLLVFIVLSTMSVANARLSDTKITIPFGPIGINKFTYNALMVWSQTVAGIIGKQFGGILRWFIGLFIVLIIPCAVIWAKKDKESNRQEQKTRGYRNNVTGLILGIGLIYGLIAIIYAYSFNK